ncbi:MAG: DPP IV N-terminal domain-containing protein [Nannocystaceae bacterium]
MKTQSPADLNDDDAPPPAPSLTTDDVAQYPLPGMLQPTSVAFSPDSAAITYLRSPDRSLSTQLYVYDPNTGSERLLIEPPAGGETEENLSIEEKLRRERQRERGLGITRYFWTHHSAAVPRIVVPNRGGIYVIDAPLEAGATLRELVPGGDKPALDPRISRDGEWVAYVQDDEIFVVPMIGGPPKQITKGARGTGRTHGLAEYIAQEEMGRSHGFWWSHDGARIAYTEVDETHIPPFRIAHLGQDAVGEAAEEIHRYPFAGQENAKVKLGVVAAAGGMTRWLDLGDAEYLARVHWLPDGRLLAELEDRAQSTLRLVAYDVKTGASTELLRETSSVWVNLHHHFRALEETEGEAAGGFVWASEESGFLHLSLHAADGARLRPLTQGEWPVDGLITIDEKAGVVYFTAGREHPTEQHLYAVPLAGGEPRKITDGPGMHGAVMSHDFTRFVDSASSCEAAPSLTLRWTADGSALRSLPVPPDPRLATLSLPPPELVELPSRDGVPLHGAIYRPPAAMGEGPFPALVSVYGGPHAQRVTRSWGLTADMRAQYFASQGYVVFKLDNRGSARRGLAFEGALRHNMGDVEVRDQVDGVAYLVERGLVDPKRVGIFGWSYGGYMAAMALARAPETFKVAIAGAPVSAWDGYDTHYTERYMGTPESNPEGYKASAVMTHVDAIQGTMLIVHGLIDENVHFRHAARLIDAMIRARKPYELLLFPEERHMPRRLEDRVYMEDRIVDFVRRSL